MSYNEIFYLVFISQIILISIIIPSWVCKRVNNMVIKYPPASYPKLYPVPIQRINDSISTFKALNLTMVVIGVLIIGTTLVMEADELMNWDTQSMLTVTFFLQVLPFFYFGFSGIKYQQLMRQVSQPTRRKATLTPRRMMDFVPQHLLLFTALSFIVYALMVVYIQQNPFPGFVGYWNILFVLLTNIFYFFMIHRIISGKKMDPHQSQEDRMIHTQLITKVLILGAILCNLFLTINLVLSLLELRHIGDIVQSLYFQLVALMMSQTNTYEPDDYDVYRSETPAI